MAYSGLRLKQKKYDRFGNEIPDNSASLAGNTDSMNGSTGIMGAINDGGI